MQLIDTLRNDDAQAGGIIMFFLGLFIIGFFYIVFGVVMNGYYDTNNQIITAGTLPYSQAHKDSLSNLFNYWWAVPLIALVIFIIYGIKNALESKTEEAY